MTMQADTVDAPAAEPLPAEPPRAEPVAEPVATEETAKGETRPVDLTERVALLDVLRGFALGGVFVSNMFVWQSGRIFLPFEQIKAAMAASRLDMITGVVANAFVAGKFITIFSILFGLGFSVQLGRADARGTHGGKLHARRMAAMFLLGVTHLLAVWYGDILSLYAVVGIFLLLFYRRRDRTILVWALVLAFVVPTLWRLGESYIPRLLHSKEELEAAMKLRMQQGNEFGAKASADIASGSYLALVRANWASQRHFFLQWHLIGFHFGLLGNFLLGFWLGRRRVFQDVPAFRRLFRHLLGWGIAFGLLGNGFRRVVGYLFMTNRLTPGNQLVEIVSPFADVLGTYGFAAAYVAAIALLFQRPGWRRVLSVLAPAGQMALTNYLLQSVLGLIVFSGLGFGLLGKVRAFWCFTIPMGLFVLEIAWSHVWLRYFRFGPAEWVWRSLTYGKAQPMRLRKGAPEAAPA
jgi:uncharacterized protein